MPKPLTLLSPDIQQQRKDAQEMEKRLQKLADRLGVWKIKSRDQISKTQG